MTTTIYRIYDETAEPAKYLMSVITDGKSASYVFPNRVEKSTSPSGLMKRALSLVEEAPSTPRDWANLAQQVMPFTSVKAEEANGSVSSLSRREQKRVKEDPKTPTYVRASEIQDRNLGDKIGLLMAEKPELSDFFESDDENLDQPDEMRDYIKLILEHYGAVDLNPELKDWLEGGEAPTEFNGLVFFPETSNDEEKK